MANPASPALHRMTPDSAAIVYVDYVTGLDNLITTIPGRQFRNNIQAFTKFSGLFKLPTAVFGEENDYYGTFLPEVRALIEAGAATFPRSTPSGCTPAFMEWLAGTGRRDVIIGGISIDNCTLHTALDLLRAGYRVQVVVDVSGSNSRLAEDTALQRLAAAGAVNAGWLNTLTELGTDFAGPYGQGMMGIIRAHWPASTIGHTHDTTPDGHGMQLPA
ncbi:isochorismatase family protein [Falsiroseomonas oryzae]|uniref:isochorismatase family protein n=1 Tax=Falsiroseomonas oryzae TaxID=2766473 RepID=UPI0022EAF148|nr:isochorismatase family protein [Roseomonas sp. MO-31]